MFVFFLCFQNHQKNITEAELNAVEDKLRKDSNKSFDNFVEFLFYPEEAIRLYLQSNSHVLKLREIQEEEIKQIEGHIIFEKY